MYLTKNDQYLFSSLEKIVEDANLENMDIIVEKFESLDVKKVIDYYTNNKGAKYIDKCITLFMEAQETNQLYKLLIAIGKLNKYGYFHAENLPKKVELHVNEFIVSGLKKLGGESLPFILKFVEGNNFLHTADPLVIVKYCAEIFDNKELGSVLRALHEYNLLSNKDLDANKSSVRAEILSKLGHMQNVDQVVFDEEAAKIIADLDASDHDHRSFIMTIMKDLDALNSYHPSYNLAMDLVDLKLNDLLSLIDQKSTTIKGFVSAVVSATDFFDTYDKRYLVDEKVLNFKDTQGFTLAWHLWHGSDLQTKVLLNDKLPNINHYIDGNNAMITDWLYTFAYHVDKLDASIAVFIQGYDHNGAFIRPPLKNLIYKMGYNVLSIDGRKTLCDNAYVTLDSIKSKTLKEFVDVNNIDLTEELEILFIDAHGHPDYYGDSHLITLPYVKQVLNKFVVAIDSVETNIFVKDFIQDFNIVRPIDIVIASCHGSLAIDKLMQHLPSGSSVTTLGKHIEIHDEDMQRQFNMGDMSFYFELEFIIDQSYINKISAEYIAVLIANKVKSYAVSYATKDEGGYKVITCDNNFDKIVTRCYEQNMIEEFINIRSHNTWRISEYRSILEQINDHNNVDTEDCLPNDEFSPMRSKYSIEEILVIEDFACMYDLIQQFGYSIITG